MNSFELRIESSFYSIHQMQTLTSAGHTISNEIIRTQEKSTEKKTTNHDSLQTYCVHM